MQAILILLAFSVVWLSTAIANAKPTLTKKSHGLTKKVTRTAKAQIGKPYRWGGGHGNSGRYGFDCSGLASFIARAAGYNGPTVTTYSAYRYSRPVRRSDKGRWVIRQWVQWGIRGSHMVVKVNGVIYEASRSGIPIRRGVDRGYHWRVPYGIKPLRFAKHFHTKVKKKVVKVKVVTEKPLTYFKVGLTPLQPLPLTPYFLA